MGGVVLDDEEWKRALGNSDADADSKVIFMNFYGCLIDN